MDNSKRNIKTQNIEFKAIKGDDLTITPSGDDFVVEGWASTYGNIDAGDDVCEKGCFTKTLSEMGSRIAFCLQHDMRNPIGKMELTDKPEGLWLKARISDAEPDIKTKIKEGILKEFSIGFQTINSSNRVADGKEVRCLNEVKLYEVSLVTLAMNEKATLQSFKSQLGVNGVDDLEELFDKAIINESNTIKKHDLMKLKILALDMIEPQNALETEKPQDDVKEVVEYLKSNFNLAK